MTTDTDAELTRRVLDAIPRGWERTASLAEIAQDAGVDFDTASRIVGRLVREYRIVRRSQFEGRTVARISYYRRPERGRRTDND